jgi:16S rRNA (guanine966-N2)-methyltransferase
MPILYKGLFMSRSTPSRTKAPRSKNGKNNHLRIIAGKWRGRKVSFPDSHGLRPTSDRVRETLFNWLAPIINNAHCLDLFSGSGALSLEALSRGAAAATLIDSSKAVSEQLRQNLKQLECNAANVQVKDAIMWLKEGNAEKNSFDLVFVDPPFKQQLVTPCCELLEQHGWVKEGGYIYIETEINLLLQLPSNWHIHREKQAGQVAYYLCIKETANN